MSSSVGLLKRKCIVSVTEKHLNRVINNHCAKRKRVITYIENEKYL